MRNKIIKSISSFLVVIILLGVGVPAVSVAAAPFSDVPYYEWFADAVDWAYVNEITTGRSQTRFVPHAQVTRGEFVTFLYRLVGKPNIEATVSFDDVANPARFYYESVAWAAGLGVVTGYGDGTFRPNNNITRQELATMLYRFAGLENDLTAPTEALNYFPDRNDVSDFAVPAMRWATYYRIVRGNTGRLLPRNTATRAESLTMLYRYVMDELFTPPPSPYPYPYPYPYPPPPLEEIGHGAVYNGVLIGPPPAATENDEHIWNFFSSKELNSYAISGIMGNLFAESGMRSNAVERAHRSRILSDMGWPVYLTAAEIDEMYTAAVNEGRYFTTRPQTHHARPIPHFNPIGSRNSFVFDRVGFGLSQWTYPTRKYGLYNFVRYRSNMNDTNDTYYTGFTGDTDDTDDTDYMNGFDISCLDAQLEFMWYELSEHYPSVLRALRNSTSIFEASNIILTRFMRPADQGPIAQGRRAGFSLGYYNRFSENALLNG